MTETTGLQPLRLELKDRLEKVYNDFVSNLPSKIEFVLTTASQLQTELNWHPQIAQNLIEVLHTLAGTSPTFGFRRLGETSKDLESLFQKALSSVDQPPINGELQKQIRVLLQTFRETTHPDEEPSYFKYARKKSEAAKIFSSSAVKGLSDQLIYLMDEDQLQLQELEVQVSNFGYKVETFQNLQTLSDVIKLRKPSALVINISLNDGHYSGPDFLERLGSKFKDEMPVIFISSFSNIEARLEAVRAGGKAYFTKPININDLVDKLDELTLQPEAEPYRIFIVENEPALANYYASIFEQDGMHTRVIINPHQLLEPLFEFLPDLILMDLYMPFCNGLDLASLIRQQSLFVSVPIVFLSSETSVEKHLDALRLGGDDFLTKPIEENRLTSLVASRCQRSRNLRSFMVRDSLTGLLNHTNVKERLASELALARRTRQALAYAMIDIDNFKTINDRYGHSTGDRVIKSLSRLIQQRLRKSDVIGRYGGEEFAVIMPNTTARAALNVMDEIRLAFSQVRQFGGEEVFSVTFSGGITEYINTEDASVLNNEADKALYHSKHSGKNRITVFDK